MFNNSWTQIVRTDTIISSDGIVVVVASLSSSLRHSRRRCVAVVVVASQSSSLRRNRRRCVTVVVVTSQSSSERRIFLISFVRTSWSEQSGSTFRPTVTKLLDSGASVTNEVKDTFQKN